MTSITTSPLDHSRCLSDFQNVATFLEKSAQVCRSSWQEEDVLHSFVNIHLFNTRATIFQRFAGHVDESDIEI